MKKRNETKKGAKKIKKTEDSKINKRRNQREPDLWKEIRMNLKPLGKAYNKFKEKRRIAKQKEEERKFKENEKQRLIEEEALRLQEQEQRRLKKEKRIKEEKESRLKAQEKQRLEEKRIIKEKNDQIKKEQIYRERLIKGEEERIKQLKRVNEIRAEERKLIEERNSKFDRSFVEQRRIKDDEEQRLKEEKQRLKDEKQRLKDEGHRLKEEEKINLRDVRRSDDEEKKKRLNGTVLWFNDAKGYGFIKREDNEKDIFVHFSSIQNSSLKYLKKGDQLTFQVDYSDKGLSAINLQKTAKEVANSHLKLIK